MTEVEDARNLFGGFGQDDEQRQLSIGGQAVAFVGAKLIVVEDDAFAGNDGAESGDDFRPAGDHPGVWFRHSHPYGLGGMVTGIM